MSLIRDAYRAEILGGLADAGRGGPARLPGGGRRRAPGAGQCPRAIPVNPGANQSAREWAPSRVDAAIVAAARQPGGTLMLRSDRLTPTELADEVLAAAGLRQVD